MKLKSILLGAALLLTSLFAQAQMAEMMQPVPVDTAVRIGKLSNGLTYYIRYNNWPEHRANFYIAQKVGSIQEDESQRGLAHFLEHMAFNGSDHFKGNDLIEWCRAHGIEFGGDLNAYTSIDQTVYNIDNVPTQQVGTLDSCLLILRDWSTGLTLDPEEIDKERGVIHEEWRMRTSAQSRMLERNLEKLYPGSKYGKRYPIGLMSVVDNFKPKELVDYYHKWYHPDHQGIIVVGDVDVNHVEAEIKRLFGGIKNPENEAPLVDEQVPDNAQPIVIIDKDKEQQTNSVQLMFKHDVFPDSLKNTLIYYIQNYVKSAAFTMMSSRYNEAVQKADCPYVAASAGDGTYLLSKTKDAFTIGVMPKDPNNIEGALKAAIMEFRRAADYGFTQTEFDRYKQNLLSSLDKMYSNRDKRYTSQFYEECLGNFLDNEPMPSIDWYYNMMKQIVPMIPLEVINQTISQFLPKNDSNMVIVNFNNEKDGAVYPTEASLLKAVSEARTAEVTPYVDNVKNEPLIKQKPKAGKIKKEIDHPKFGYKELQLSNGVKVYLKKTDFKKDAVSLSGEGWGGSSLYGPADYVNLSVFDNVIAISGLGDFSSTELSKALAGKIANANLSMNGARHMGISGSSTPKDVETMMQMVYLYFTNIKKDTATFANLKDQLRLSLKNRSLSPDVALQDTITATLYGHNPRLKPLLMDDIDKIDYDRILQIARERTANAYGWEFQIIGNFDEDSIRPLICQYLGALPAKKGKLERGERVAFLQKGQINNIFNRKMETPKANAYMIWYSEDVPYSLAGSIKASVAGQILSMEYLKKIREDASAAYSCGAQGSASLADDGYHVYELLAVCPMKPEKRDIAMKILAEGVPELANTCDADKLKKVKDLMLKQADDAEKSNGYWSNVMYYDHKYGIDIHTDYKKIVSSLTPADISSFVKDVLKSGNKFTIAMFPEE